MTDGAAAMNAKCAAKAAIGGAAWRGGGKLDMCNLALLAIPNSGWRLLRLGRATTLGL
jgi:hypothetical protein